MKQSSSPDVDKQFRKAAILLASLDESLAEQLLAQMPDGEADQVREALWRLEDVDDAEQDLVLAEFNQSRALPEVKSESNAGVELDPSLLARLEQPESDTYRPQTQSPKLTFDSLSNAEAEKIAETLLQEHPQTVALVISRLTPQAAGKVLAQFPEQLQTEVLGRVGELDPADDSSTQIVESYMAKWVREHRQREHRLAAGSELVHKILENTPNRDHMVVEGKIRRDQVPDAPILGRRRAASARQSNNKPRTFRQQRYVRQPRMEPVEPSRYDDIDRENPLQVLESADDATFLAALTTVDAGTVSLALAGASEALLTRVLKRLPRSQAKRMRSQVRNIGPTRLSDMLEAQMQLARFVKDHQIQ